MLREILAVCVGLVFAMAGLTQSSQATGGKVSSAATVNTGIRLELEASNGTDRRLVPDLAVVPIIINTGAALFPTIMAFLANIAAVAFNPKRWASF